MNAIHGIIILDRFIKNLENNEKQKPMKEC